MKTQSVLVIGFDGMLKELQCPFKVYSVKAINGIPAFRAVQVDEVFACPHYKLQFVVNDCAYPYDIFRFLDDFLSKFRHSCHRFTTE